MAARNFWIECDIDGRKTRLEGGPRRKDGGFELTIWQRSEGGRMKAFAVQGFVVGEELHLEATPLAEGCETATVIRTRR